MIYTVWNRCLCETAWAFLTSFWRRLDFDKLNASHSLTPLNEIDQNYWKLSNELQWYSWHHYICLFVPGLYFSVTTHLLLSHWSFIASCVVFSFYGCSRALVKISNRSNTDTCHYCWLLHTISTWSCCKIIYVTYQWHTFHCVILFHY